MKQCLIPVIAVLALSACSEAGEDPAPATEVEDAIAVPAATPVTNVTAVELMQQIGQDGIYQRDAGELARTKSSNAAVMSFAQRMISDHSAISTNLKSIADTDPKLALPTQLDEQHAELVTALRAAGASEFDELYRQQQQQAHERTLALLQAYAARGDDDVLKAFANDTVPVAQGHLDLAKQLPQ